MDDELEVRTLDGLRVETAGVEGEVAWIACDCGVMIARRVTEEDTLPCSGK